MAISESYKQFVDDQLDGIDGVYSKKMFGGVGYFINGKIFGCIMGGVFRLKTIETTCEKFKQQGMEPYTVPGKNMTMSYYEVPEIVLEDKEQLHKWSLEAWSITKLKK